MTVTATQTPDISQLRNEIAERQAIVSKVEEQQATVEKKLERLNFEADRLRTNIKVAEGKLQIVQTWLAEQPSNFADLMVDPYNWTNFAEILGGFSWLAGARICVKELPVWIDARKAELATIEQKISELQ